MYRWPSGRWRRTFNPVSKEQRGFDSHPVLQKCLIELRTRYPVGIRPPMMIQASVQEEQAASYRYILVNFYKMCSGLSSIKYFNSVQLSLVKVSDLDSEDGGSNPPTLTNFKLRPVFVDRKSDEPRIIRGSRVEGIYYNDDCDVSTQQCQGVRFPHRLPICQVLLKVKRPGCVPGDVGSSPAPSSN